VGGGKWILIAPLLGWGGFEGKLIDGIHQAPCSGGAKSETTHIGQVKFDLQRLPNMSVKHWIKMGISHGDCDGVLLLGIMEAPDRFSKVARLS